MRGLAVDVLEHPAELRRRQVRDRGEGGYVEGLGVAPVHLVAGAEHPAVGVLLRRGLPRARPMART